MDASSISMYLKETWATIYMTLISSSISYLIGIPLGVILCVTDKDGIRPCAPINRVLGLIVNIFRSVPFMILLVMVLPLSGANLAAVLMALATGLTIVTARTVNARLADRQGAIRATVMNYVTGLTTSCVMLLLLGRGEPMLQGFRLSGNWFMYLAGALGVVLTVILNVTVSRVSAFALTLLQFTGQIFTGLLLDALLAGCFSVQSAVGGLLVAVGLGLNTWLDSRRK